MLCDENWNPLLGPALDEAAAAVAAGARLKIGTSRGERLMSDAEEAALRNEWLARAAEQTQARAQADAEQADIEAARQFARLQALRAMNPAEVSGYISARYPAPAGNLAEANAILTRMRDDLETLAIGMAILARKL